MAHQLQIYVDLRPNAFHDRRMPVRAKRTRTRTTRPRLEAHDSFFVSSGTALSTNVRVYFSQKGSGTLSASIVIPGYSSLPRRSKRHEMQAGDGFMEIAEWVFRKVKDPMVEIDPITVEGKIKAEKEMAREEEQVFEQDESKPTDFSEETTATVAPATSLQPPSEFSQVNTSTNAAGVALILAAVALAYLGFRSKSALSKPKENSESFPTSPGIGGRRDPGTSRVIHHSPSTPAHINAPPQNLHEQFRSSCDGDSSNKAVAYRASAELMSWQSQTTETPKPAVASHGKKTAFPSSPSAPPHGSSIVEEEKVVSYEDLPFSESSSDRDLPLGKPSAEILVVNGAGHDSNPAGVAESQKEAKPFEEVVAVKGVGHDSTPAKVAGLRTDAVEFENALIFDKPQAAKGLLPEEDTSPSQLKLVITMETSSRPLVEDCSVSNLDADLPAHPVNEGGPVKETLNGAAASTSDAQSEEQKRKSYAEAILAVVPVIAVGAGALSTWSGVASGLEMVGLVATASFLARDIIMASSRQQLFGDFGKVKDHKSFLEFLQRRQIIRDLRQERKKT